MNETQNSIENQVYDWNEAYIVSFKSKFKYNHQIQFLLITDQTTV